MAATEPTTWHLPGGGSVTWQIMNPERLEHAQEAMIKAVLKRIEPEGDNDYQSTHAG